MHAGRRVATAYDRPMDSLPARVRLVIFDLDGVVYRGDEAVPGASELVGWLHGSGVTVRFATNNSMVERAGYVHRLAALGIPAAAEEIVTSSSATVEHLRRHAPEVRTVLAIGADGLRAELVAAGLVADMARDITQDPPGAPLERAYDAVVVGLDPEFEYRRMSVAMSAVAAGARLIATNADSRYPTPAGFVPGAGSMVAALAAATGVTPEVIGKPEPAMFRSILEETGVPAAETVVVGDNPASDIVGARRSGCASILVLTGVATAEDAAGLSGERAPHAVAADPGEVRELLERRLS